MALNDSRVVPAVAVSDMGKAKEFYEGKLGLSGGEEQGDGGTTYPCGSGTEIHVYPSPDNAGSSGATLCAFEVGDVDSAVDDLSSAGVSLEKYDSGDFQTNEKGIADFGTQRGGWFKDPDGNILSVWQRS
jgi:catechol 2,3-dioxygenase-like lactoylglutathione lyase family enzyme